MSLLPAKQPGYKKQPSAKKLFHLGSLPAPVINVLDQAGLLTDGRPLTWAKDPRIITGLLDALEAHNGKYRRHGPKLSRGIHEAWIAHRMANDNDIKTWLADKKLDPNLAAFCGITHDLPENFRKLAEDKGIAYDPEALIQKIIKIWNKPASNSFIRQCLAYATDDPKLHGKKRIKAQEEKSFNVRGRCILDPLRQGIRVYDKLSHVMLDAVQCMLGNVTPEQALVCYNQAIRKSFPLRFPIGKKLQREYIAAMTEIWAIIDPRAQAKLTALGLSPDRFDPHAERRLFEKGAAQITQPVENRFSQAVRKAGQMAADAAHTIGNAVKILVL